MAGPIEQKKLPPLSERLERLGLLSDWDFVFHLPLRYEDETAITPIGELVPDTGVPSQCQGTVLRAGFRATSRGQIYVAEIADDTGTLGLSFFTYYRNITSTIRHGEVVRVFGQVRRGYFDETRLEMVHPKVRKPLFDAANLPKTLTPVYPTGEGIQQTWLRKRIHRALLDLNVRDLVPADLTESLGLPRLNAALGYLHNPPADAPVASLQDRTAPAWQRLKFDELLAQQITLAESRRRRRDLQAPHLDKPGENLVDAFLASLPFALTNAQKRVWREIEEDLGKDAPMHRLVQGDVGSGKTVVAALSLLRALECGHQAVLMAPTELLAEHLDFKQTGEPIALHITCSSRHMGIEKKFLALARLCSSNVMIPEEVGCCGFAGDRGFTHPEVNRYALRKLRPQLEKAHIKRGFSNSRTCEIGLSTNAGIPYQSIVYLVDECTTKKNK